MKIKNQLDIQDIHTVCQYLHSEQDYLNIMMTCKKYRTVFDFFQTNPIPLTQSNRKFFSQIEWQSLQTQHDKRFSDGKIKGYILCYPIDYCNSLNEIENGIS